MRKIFNGTHARAVAFAALLSVWSILGFAVRPSVGLWDEIASFEGGRYSMNGQTTAGKEEIFSVCKVWKTKEERDEEIETGSLSERVKKGVYINGVSVGGLPKREAVKKVVERENGQIPSLVVRAPSGTYLYSPPEICLGGGFLQAVTDAIDSSEKNTSYAVKPTYFLCGQEEKAARICADNSSACLNASVSFSDLGFSYEREREGITCDGEKLSEDIRLALRAPSVRSEVGGESRLIFPEVTLKTEKISPAVSLAALQKDTVKIASFTTYYAVEDRGRCANIALASKLLDGYAIRPFEEFSFNAAVGERTKKRGFKDAKIILSGEYVLGAGGGVCQVSTTLFNAAVRAGMKITERRPHSLRVGYVPPSTDAMVSTSSDLKFKNPFKYPVYLSVKVGEGSVTATFYGRKTGYSYRLVSEILEETEPPEPLIRYGEREGEIKKGKSGAVSVSWLETYCSGSLVTRKVLYKDVYAPTRGIIGKKIGNRTNKMP